MDANSKLEALKKFYGSMEGKNHFEILGIDQTADDAAVRTAYFALLKQYGADYFHHVVEADSKKAVDEVNRRLRQAYDAIGKKSKRDAYIESLKGGKPGESAAPLDLDAVFESEQAVSMARALMERGDFGVAITKLEKAIKIDPKNTEIQVRLAYSRYMMMEVDENGKRPRYDVKNVVETLEKACEIMTSADYLRVYLGDIAKLEGDDNKATIWYKNATKINPENIQAKRALKLIEERKNREKEKTNEPKSFGETIKSWVEKLKSIKIGN